MKKTGKAEAVPLLILAVGLVLLIYAYFLPVNEKCALIPSLPECKIPEKANILGFNPGLLQKQDTAAVYVFPESQLFRRETIDIATILENEETSSSWFVSSPKQAVFKSQANEREAKLFIFVNKAHGKLKLYLNGVKVGVIGGEGMQQLKLNTANLDGTNVLKIVPTMPILPFLSNSYSIGKIVLKEDYVITNNRVSLPFSVKENPKDILDIKLSFRTNCFTDDNLTVLVANETLTDERICEGINKDITDIIIENNMSGEITLASEGNYVVEDMMLNVRMQERTWPTYYFYVNSTDKPIMLKLGFNESGLKKLTAYVNEEAISIETAKKEWQTTVNKYLRAGSTNSVILIPETTLTVSKLEVA
jgi:hypothetical protein